MLNVLWLVGMMFASQWGMSAPLANNTEKGLLGGGAVGSGIGALVGGAVQSEHRIVACWNDRVHHCDDVVNSCARVSMLKGSVYLHCGETKKTVCAKGCILVEAFDNQARKIAQWQFDAASLEKLKRTDLIGVGYTLCLPMDQRCLEVNDIQLKLTYRGDDGRQCCDEPSRLRMRFDPFPVVPAVHVEKTSQGKIPPIPARFDHEREPQVQFNVLMAQLSPAAMKQLKVEFQETKGAIQHGILKDCSALTGTLESMGREGQASIISRPQIITLSGSVASFRCDTNMPVNQTSNDGLTRVFKQYHMTMSLLPRVTDPGKIHLDFTGGGARVVATLNDGQTLVVHNANFNVGADEKQSLVCIVTPRLFKPATVATAAKTSKQMTFTEIATMSKRGISDDIIIRQMQLTESMYDLTTEQILSLNEQGVSNGVIRAMQERRVYQQTFPSPYPRANPAY
jgi:hypothetical protein